MFDALRKMARRAMGGGADDSGETDPPVAQEGEDWEDDPQTDEQFVQLVDRRATDWYTARKPYEIVWNQCMALYLGLHYHNWNRLDQSLTEGRAPSYRVRMVVNHCFALVKTYLGKLMRGDPQMRTRPGDPTDTAFYTARVADKVLRGLWRLLDGREVEQEFLYWMVILGHAYWKVGWDPTMGKRVEFPGFEPVNTGEVSWTVMGGFPILTPPDSPPLRMPTELIEVRIRQMPWIRQVFGARGREVRPDASMDARNSYEARFASMVSPAVAAGNYGQAGGGYAKAAIVREHWTDPELLSDGQRKRFPNGRLIITADKKLLALENNPFSRTKKHPYVEVRGEHVPGRYHGMSVLEQGSAPQKAYNRGRSQIIEARNLASNPVLDVEKNHGIAVLGAEPGSVAERRQGSPAPQWRTPPQMSQFLVQDVVQSLQDFEAVTQMRQASKGEAPAANITGVALELLQEADNNPMTPLALRVVAGLARVGSKTINITQEFYGEDRILEVTGENQETEVMVFRADEHQAELRTEVTIDSVLPSSRAAKRSRVEDGTRLGYLDPMRDRATGLRLLEFGDDEQLYEMADLDRQKQARELQRMLQGQPQLVVPFDEHVTHLDCLNRFRKTTAYETAPPEIRAIIDQHALGHEQAIAMQQMQAQQAAQGSMPAPRAAPKITEEPAVAGGLDRLTGGQS